MVVGDIAGYFRIGLVVAAGDEKAGIPLPCSSIFALAADGQDRSRH